MLSCEKIIKVTVIVLATGRLQMVKIGSKPVKHEIKIDGFESEPKSKKVLKRINQFTYQIAHIFF